MATLYHEQVNHDSLIPAMINILESTELNKHIYNDMFIPTHWHRSLEISYIENCEVVLQIGKKELIIENDFTCINSGVLHSLNGQEIKDNARGIIVLFSYDFIKQYYPMIDNVYFDLSIKKDHQDLKKLYFQLAQLYKNKDSYSYLNITACLLEILSLLLRNYKIDKKVIKTKTTVQQEQIKNILNYIHNHYQEELSLDTMAKLFHVSKEHFSRQFHYFIGKTYREYLASYRLYKAYDDVTGSNMSIQDIARKHGFSNVRSFIKLFHDVYNETPLKYRKQELHNYPR